MGLLTLESLQKDSNAKYATLHNHLAGTQRELNQIIANHAEQLTNVTNECGVLPVLIERINHLGAVTQDIQDRVAIMLEGMLVALIKAEAITQAGYDESVEIARADYYAKMQADALEAGIIHPVPSDTPEPPVPRGLGNNETEDPDGGAQAPTVEPPTDDDDENAVGVE
jgi:hypothetical protein